MCCIRRRFGAIIALGVLLMAIFLIWLAVADAIYIANFGYHGAGLDRASSPSTC